MAWTVATQSLQTWLDLNASLTADTTLLTADDTSVTVDYTGTIDQVEIWTAAARPSVQWTLAGTIPSPPIPDDGIYLLGRDDAFLSNDGTLLLAAA